MTFEAYIYLIPAIFGIFWPVVTMFCKRNVMVSQWVLMGAFAMTSITMLLYSTFFMPPFRQEHLLCHLYVMMALLTPAVFMAGAISLTNEEGFTRSLRRFFILPVVAMLVISAVAQFGGIENYQDFLATAVHGGDLSFKGELNYDLMVSIEFYGFLAVLAVEVFMAIYYVLPSVRKYIHLVEENFSVPRQRILKVQKFMTALFVIIMLLALLEVCYPLHFLTSKPVLVLVCLLQSFVIFTLGYLVFRLRHSAEQLAEMKRDAEVVVDQFHKMGLDEQVSVEQVSEQVRSYLEDCKGFLDPTVSVFKIARQFHLDQTTIVQSIYLLKGTTFSEYINSLRVEYALGVVMERIDNGLCNIDEYEQRKFTDSLAASSGFTSTASFYIGFTQVMGMPFDTWMRAMVG